ncbi:MAG: hypothetical protein RLZZ592_1384 [Pseudomonadota bacterium]|jgi:hypothetical protein
MNTIVISHRRQDSRDVTRMLFERLLHYFPGRVVLGLEGSLPLDNVRLRAARQMQGCGLLLVLIGPDWCRLADEHGVPRLHDPRDGVRLEISSALQQGIAVVPVLLDGATMPDEHDLPADLHGLLDVQPQHLAGGCGRTASLVALVASIRQQLGEEEALRALARSTMGVSSLSAAGPAGGGFPGQGAQVLPLLAEPETGRGEAWPVWAIEGGEDAFGRWAEIEVVGVRQRLRLIEPGMFLMGAEASAADRFDDEMPRHAVTLTRGFWLADSACARALWSALLGDDPGQWRDRADLPVDSVSWNDIQALFLPALAHELGHGVRMRLPTEAEWEYACRAGTRGAFHFEGPPSLRWMRFGGDLDGPGPVTALPANAWGLHQMHGNVWEWCEDGKRTYGRESVVDPTGGQTGISRVLRGGSWAGPARWARSSCRFEAPRSQRLDDAGFRFLIEL